MPAINSRALGRSTVGCTITPSMTAFGSAARARARMPAAASRTAATLDRFRRTPSTSDLCAMSPDNTFKVTVRPIASSGSASKAASLAVVATCNGTIGMP